jgi:16S rRNA (uracil1498-N3)-methyltransferase
VRDERTRRVFAPDAAAGVTVVLDAGESHHLAAVLRQIPGARVEVFDGKGTAFEGRVESILKDRVTVNIGAEVSREEVRGPKTVVATAMPKGDRLELIVEKCSELGLSGLWPMITVRSVVKTTEGSRKLERLRLASIESAKQCGRNEILSVREPMDFREVISEASEFDVRLIASTADGTDFIGARFAAIRSAKSIVCLVGPEGGFTDTESEMAMKAEMTPVSLGENILRIETAAIFAAAAIKLARGF